MPVSDTSLFTVIMNAVNEEDSEGCFQKTVALTFGDAAIIKR